MTSDCVTTEPYSFVSVHTPRVEGDRYVGHGSSEPGREGTGQLPTHLTSDGSLTGGLVSDKEKRPPETQESPLPKHKEILCQRIKSEQ